jgi:hypothetical protein
VAVGVTHCGTGFVPGEGPVRPLPSATAPPEGWSDQELTELVEVVIGVDTHKHTHAAAVLDARTGAVIARLTVPADPNGYARLTTLAEQHRGLRAWAKSDPIDAERPPAMHWAAPSWPSRSSAAGPPRS